VRPLKLILGFFLLPLCWAATRAFLHVVEGLARRGLHQLPVETWWLLGGFALWLFLFAALPRPFRTYVLAHELTHAFWGYLMGAKVSGLRVARSGGSVRVTKTNVLITLAPYFFPFYTVCVLMLYGLLSWRYDLTAYTPWWLAAIGFTWSFHLTFTLTVLMQRQPDIEEHGRVFSYTFIYLLNAIGMAVWIIAVTPASLTDFIHQLISEGRTAYLGVGHLLQLGWKKFQPL
jgi:hypothetical protein